MKITGLSKIEKLKLIGQCVKAATAIIGGSLILSEGHPYWSISILALGGVANEILSFIKERENQQLTDSVQPELIENEETK